MQSKQYKVTRSFYEGNTLHSEGEPFVHGDQAYINKCLEDGNIAEYGGEPAPNGFPQHSSSNSLPISFTTPDAKYHTTVQGEGVSAQTLYFKNNEQISAADYSAAYEKSVTDAGGSAPAAPLAPASPATGDSTPSSVQAPAAPTPSPASPPATSPAATSATHPTQDQIENDMAFASGEENSTAAPSLQ